MSCKHPLKAFPIGIHPSGKTKYKICSYDVDHLEYKGENIIYATSKFRSPYSDKVVREFVEIPCGKCSACRLDYSRQWADRLMLELSAHEDAWFVTLTYNDEHLPKSIYDSSKDLENVISNYTDNNYIKDIMYDFFSKTKGISSPLVKKDVQNFMKRLRKAYNKKYPGEKLRFYAAGEYGEEKGRPHYHLIIFGLHLNDLKPSFKSKLGYQYYESDFLDNAWSIYHKKTKEKPAYYEPIGFVVVGEVTWETCAYTARYIMKKQYGEKSKDFYNLLGITPEFTLMSNSPGIGREYYEHNKIDIYKYDNFNLATDKGGRKLRAPRYYDKLFAIEFPETMEQIKEHRKKLAEDAKNKKMSKTSLSYQEQLQVEEDVLNRKIKKLIRSVD